MSNPRKPLTLPALIKWLKKQEPEATYDYVDHSNCLIAQFARAQGYPVLSATGRTLELSTGNAILFPETLDKVARHDALNFAGLSRSFGGALKAAKALLGEP